MSRFLKNVAGNIFKWVGIRPTNQTSRKFQAEEDLKMAIKELSGFSKNPRSQPPSASKQEYQIDLLKKKLPHDMLEAELVALARAYYEGETVDADIKMAVTLWKEAVSRGSAEALYNLAVCYKEGNGTEKDHRKALDIFLQLAEKNYALAHVCKSYSLGILLSSGGEGIDVNDEQAFTHFMAAAKGGVLPALHNTANCYANGRGVKQSDKNALLFYEAAAECGDPSALFTLGTWLYSGRGGVKDHKKSHALQLQAAELGHPAAMFNIGVTFMDSQGVVPVDYALAASWFQKSMDKGFVHAAVNLGNMYRDGLGVEKNNAKAFEIFQRFAPQSPVCAELSKSLALEMAASMRKR